MKLIKLSALLVLALALSLGTTGCKRNIQKPTVLPGSKTYVQPDGPGYDKNLPLVDPKENTFGTPLPTSWTRKDVTEDPTRFAPFTVHFAFDSASIRSGEQGKISSVAADLQANQGLKLIIEGHCDERGTEGYNQALGEKRAISLREELIKLGVNPERILTASFGEMRPAADGHDESAWSQNRRGVFIAATPK